MITPQTRCRVVWPQRGNPEHLHACIKDEVHGGAHLCRCGARLHPATVVTPSELDPAVRAGHRQRIAETLDAIKLCVERKDRP